MEIRRAERNDIPGRAAAFYVRIRAMNVDEFGIPVDREIDEREDHEYVVAYDDGHPVATCRLHIIDGKTAKIERVVTLKDYRGAGVGRSVVTEAERWLKERGISKVIITSRDEAVGFYEKLGYTADYDRLKDQEKGMFTIVYTEKEL